MGGGGRRVEIQARHHPAPIIFMTSDLCGRRRERADNGHEISIEKDLPQMHCAAILLELELKPGSIALIRVKQLPLQFEIAGQATANGIGLLLEIYGKGYNALARVFRHNETGLAATAWHRR